MHIKLNELEQLFKIFINSAKKSNFNELKLDEDYYWAVASDDREKINDKPELIVGSLVDDHESLKKILSKENPFTVVDLERLGNLLISLSENISKSKKVLLD